MDMNVTVSFAETLQRLNWAIKCDPGGGNCTIQDALGINATNDTAMDHFPQCERAEMAFSELVFMILYGVVGIIGILGNTLVIYVVVRYSNMQTVTNMYILNLAIADECFLIGIPFLIATMQMHNWTFGVGLCKLYLVSTSITQFASSIFLLVMSADRYIAICHHVSSPRYRTPTVSRMVSTLAWCCSALIMLPIIIYGTAIEHRPGHYTCNIEWPESNDHSGMSFTLYSLFLGFAIPLSFIMTFYLLVIRKLRKVSKRTSNKSQNKRRSHRKVTKLVLTVITVYILCWSPYWISQVALITWSAEVCYTQLHITIFLFVGCLGYSNSAINPILYAYLSDNFKKSFMKACVCAGVREVNAQLKLENSVLPRKLRNRSFLEPSTTTAIRGEMLTATTTTNTSSTVICKARFAPTSPIRDSTCTPAVVLRLSDNGVGAEEDDSSTTDGGGAGVERNLIDSNAIGVARGTRTNPLRIED